MMLQGLNIMFKGLNMMLKGSKTLVKGSKVVSKPMPDHPQRASMLTVGPSSRFL